MVGHEKIISFFDNLTKNGNLSHAYCFVGQEHVGKRAVAEEMAAKILNVGQNKLVINPDFLLVEQEKNEKTEKTQRDISIEQIQNAILFLNQSALTGSKKVVIVDQAEKMNISAANAFLKTLEEPKSGTVVFLLTKNEAELPKTILSRCQQIIFNPVPREEIKSEILNKGLVEDEAEEMSKLCFGLPGLTFGWLQNKEKYLWFKSEVQRFNSLPGKSFHDKIKTIEDLFGDKTDHILARNKMNEVLNIWLLILRERIRNVANMESQTIFTDSTFFKLSADDLLVVEDSIKQAQNFLQKNIHPRLLIENILLKLP